MSNLTWKTYDKEWMKDRRAKWKEVQFRLKEFDFIRKDFHAAIKQYFLTGEISDGLYSLNNFEAKPLIELWLHPDDSEENMTRIKAGAGWKWSDSKRFYESIVSNLGTFVFTGSTESFFDGRDERLYYLFFDRRLKSEDYPSLSETEFHEKSWKKYQSVLCGIMEAILGDVFNPYNSLNYRLEEWRDAIEQAYDPERVEFDWVVQLVDRVHRNPDQFTPEQVDLAKRVAAILSDPTLPEQVKADIDAFRQRPCHPDCTNFEED